MVEARAAPDSFKVHERLCIIIGNVDYQILRNGPYSNMIDLPSAQTNVDIFYKCIQRYGFDPLSIVKETDVSHNKITELIRGAKTKIEQN